LALFTPFSLPCVSKAASNEAKITQKLLAEQVLAVLSERIFVQAMKSPKLILPYLQGI